MQYRNVRTASTLAATRAPANREEDERADERQRGQLHLRRVSIRDLERPDQRISKRNPADILRHELDAKAEFLRLQGRSEESVHEVSAHGSRGERHPGLRRLIAPTIALQTRMSHGDT